jgi:pre-rRNA-processing protein TSR4
MASSSDSTKEQALAPSMDDDSKILSENAATVAASLTTTSPAAATSPAAGAAAATEPGVDNVVDDDGWQVVGASGKTLLFHNVPQFGDSGHSHEKKKRRKGKNTHRGKDKHRHRHHHHGHDSDIDSDDDDGTAGLSFAASRPWVFVPGAYVGKQGTDAYTSKVGGVPDWLLDESMDTPPAIPACDLCKEPLHLIVQLFAPLSSTTARTLYVFGCNFRDCCIKHEMAQDGCKSWRVYRAVMSIKPEKNQFDDDDDDVYPESPPTPEPLFDTGVDDWGDDGGFFGDDIPASVPASNAVSDNVDDLGAELDAMLLDATVNQDKNESIPASKPDSNNRPKKKGPKKTKEELKQERGLLRPYYLMSDREPLDEKESEHDEHIDALLRAYESRENETVKASKGGSTSEQWQETYEEYGDVVFERFTERIARCSEQCLRHDRGGPVLWSSKSKRTSHSPVCSACGGKTTFEFQLVPYLLYTIEDELGPTGMDWGTVVVYTCASNCNPKKYCEEFCLVQQLE